MIEFQLGMWTALSVIGGLVTYVILTEGKNKFLFVTTFFYSLFIGMGTSYIWLQATRGLALYSWTLYILPLFVSCIATILFLSYYKAYHGSATFPRVPTFTAGRTSAMVSLVAVVVLSLLLASSYFPSTAPSPSMTVLGSTSSAILSEDDVADVSECIDCIKSKDILIQKSMVSPTNMRENPKIGEYLDFRVELMPSFSYLQPSMKVYIKDWTGNLVSSSKITAYPSTSNVMEGQVYCDTPGVYTITAVVYDESVSSTKPMASNSLSYTVAGDAGVAGVTEPVDIFTVYMILFFVVIVAMIWMFALFKRFKS